MRFQQAQEPSVGLKQDALEVYKEDYFKINASPRSGGGSVRGIPLIAIRQDHWRKPWVK